MTDREGKQKRGPPLLYSYHYTYVYSIPYVSRVQFDRIVMEWSALEALHATVREVYVAIDLICPDLVR